MPDFYAKTFVRDTGHEKIDSMPDLFKGKMFGVWTTDGEPPTFDGMTPVNFTVDNSIEILSKCISTQNVGYIPDNPNPRIVIGADEYIKNEVCGIGYQLDSTWFYYTPGVGIAFDYVEGVLNNKVYLVGSQKQYTDGSVERDLYFVTINNVDNKKDVRKIGYDVKISIYKKYGDTSESTDKEGSYDNSSEDITIPTNALQTDNGIVNVPFPIIGATNLGMITLWRVTQADINNIGQILWSSSFIDSLVKSFYSPIDAIISLNLIPSIENVYTYGNGEIALGNYNTNIVAPKLASQFFDVDMGTYTFDEYWASALDYNPYTTIQLFLPYIGMVNLSPDDVMSKTIHVVYVCDVLTGQLNARVFVSTETGETLLYTFNGNFAINIPITGANYSDVYKAAIQGTVGLAKNFIGMGTGSAMGVMGSALDVVSDTANATSNAKIQYQNGSSMSLTSGYLAPQFCYVIISRPLQSLAKDYNKFVGYPSNVTAQLSTLSGFTMVEDIHLENLSATDNEIDEIESLLKSGVII